MGSSRPRRKRTYNSFREELAYLDVTFLKSAKIKKAFTKAKRKKGRPIAGVDLNVLIQFYY